MCVCVLALCVYRSHVQVVDSCTVKGLPPAVCDCDRKRPLGLSDLKGSSSGSAHTQLFLSLKCEEEEGLEV